MSRTSKHGRLAKIGTDDVFQTSPQIPFTRVSHTQSLQDQLLETRLRIERAKLAKLEADIPDPSPKYTRYEDMPPPTPEDEARFLERFKDLISRFDDEELEERLDRFR